MGAGGRCGGDAVHAAADTGTVLLGLLGAIYIYIYILTSIYLFLPLYIHPSIYTHTIHINIHVYICYAFFSLLPPAAYRC